MTRTGHRIGRRWGRHTKRGRLEKAILFALNQYPNHWMESVAIRSHVFDRMGTQTPNAGAIGHMLRVMHDRGLIERESHGGLKERHLYRSKLNEEE